MMPWLTKKKLWSPQFGLSYMGGEPCTTAKVYLMTNIRAFTLWNLFQHQLSEGKICIITYIWTDIPQNASPFSLRTICCCNEYNSPSLKVTYQNSQESRLRNFLLPNSVSETTFCVLLILKVHFYLCDLHQVIVTQAVTGYDDPQEVRRLQRGDYFGEKALLRYMALSLSRELFQTE